MDRSVVILQIAKSKARSKEELEDINFYSNYFTQIKLNKDQLTYSKLHQDANNNNDKSKYIHYRDLFKLVTYEYLYAKDSTGNFTNEEKEKLN